MSTTNVSRKRKSFVFNKEKEKYNIQLNDSLNIDQRKTKCLSSSKKNILIPLEF